MSDQVKCENCGREKQFVTFDFGHEMFERQRWSCWQCDREENERVFGTPAPRMFPLQKNEFACDYCQGAFETNDVDDGKYFGWFNSTDLIDAVVLCKNCAESQSGKKFFVLKDESTEKLKRSRV